MRDFISRIWGWNDQWQEKDFSAHFDPRNITLVHKDKQLVGYSHVEDRGGELFIRMLIVHPQYQGKGIGKKLLESVIRSSLEKSRPIRLEVFKINNKAKEYYERHGFSVEGETSSSYFMSRT